MVPAFLKSASTRQRKVGFWVPALILGYTVLGFLILPPILRVVAIKQLSQNLDREVSLQKVKLNPYTLSTTIRGLLIKDKDLQPFVSWDEVYVNFQLSSFLGRPWVFKEITVSNPYVRVQVNKDYTLNFSDLATKFSTNSEPGAPSKPLALSIDRLHIDAARSSLADLTPRIPFSRLVGPLSVTLMNFRTAPDNRNPYSFSGTTDAGEKFAWSGFFYLDPIRSEGQFSLENIALTNFAPLYQDLIRFEIKDGVANTRSTYHLELSPTNRIASVTNTSFGLRSLKLQEPGKDSSLVELAEFSISGASADAVAKQAEVASITATDGRLALRRNRESTINVVELSKPSETATNAPGGVLLLLQSVTNVAALLLDSTNLWSGSIHRVNFQNCALSLEDLVNSRPARLYLDQISLQATNLSNLPITNTRAALSLRWNTNGSIKSAVTASVSPPTAEIDLDLERLDLRPLDPYLESKVRLFIRDSKLSINGHLTLSTTGTNATGASFHAPNTTNLSSPSRADSSPAGSNANLTAGGVDPERLVASFRGHSRLDDFSTIDATLSEDLLKWKSLSISGIDANLNPPAVVIDEVRMDGASARVIIETNRTINLLTAMGRGDTNALATPVSEPGEREAKKGYKKIDAEAIYAKAGESPASQSETTASALPKILVKNVILTNTTLRFTDRSVSPTVDFGMMQTSGMITNLSSEPLDQIAFRFNTRVDNVGPVEINGTIQPFARNQTNNIRIVAKNVDLTPTSPYVGKFAGYRLTRGKLELDLMYYLVDSQIKAENRIVLDRFTLGEKVNSPEATKLPVRLGVAMLKDRDGKIKLDVPVEGSLDDPQFKLHKVIVSAIGNLLTKIATAPFTALGAIFGGKGEELSYQEFAAGSAELETAGKEKLDHLLKGLYERPALEVEIEGSVEPDVDRDGLRKAELDKKLRHLKWISLNKSDKAATTSDALDLPPEERSKWIRKLYTDAVAKGEIVVSGSGTNLNSATAAHNATTPQSDKPSASAGQGAAALLKASPPAALPKPTKSATGSQSRRAAVSDAMEEALMEKIPVPESGFHSLAAKRASAVREYLVQSGKVEAERIFFTERQGHAKSEGSRAYLQLR